MLRSHLGYPVSHRKRQERRQHLQGFEGLQGGEAGNEDCQTDSAGEDDQDSQANQIAFKEFGEGGIIRASPQEDVAETIIDSLQASLSAEHLEAVLAAPHGEDPLKAMEPDQGDRVHERHRSAAPRGHGVHQLPALQGEGRDHRQRGERIQEDRIWEVS